MADLKDTKQNKKPEKRIYDNQEDIIETILEKLRKDLPSNSEAYIFGSVAEKKFGKYVKEYKGHKGSDIDVIVFCSLDAIPSHWKYLNVSKGWWNLYRGIKIKINGTLHKTDILLVKEGFEGVARTRIKEKSWIVIKIIS